MLDYLKALWGLLSDWGVGPVWRWVIVALAVIVVLVLKYLYKRLKRAYRRRKNEA